MPSLGVPGAALRTAPPPEWRAYARQLLGDVPASVLPCRVRRRAALRWRLRSSWPRGGLLRPFRLRVAVTEDAPTAPSSVAESARGGSRGTPAGGAPGIGSTALSAACWRACSRKEVKGGTIGGGGGVMPLVCHGRARRGRVSAGARSE